MKKVLLVDDSRLTLEMWKTTLTRPGLQLFTASNGVEALALHQREQVQLILTDLRMPVMDGAALCAAIRDDEGLRQVSLVVISVSDAEGDRQRCLAAGANDYLTKPVAPAELVNRVLRFVDIPARRAVRVLARVELRGVEHEGVLGRTIDISASGMFAEVEAILKAEDSLICRFSLPNSKRELTTECAVVRIAGPRDGIPCYGLRFVGITENVRASIEAYVDGGTPLTQ